MPAIASNFSQASSWIEVPGDFWQNESMNTLDFRCAASPSALRAAILGGFLFALSGRADTNLTSVPLPWMTSIREIREVSPEQAARRYPALVRGVVTFCDARSDWGLFLHDATAGIYVKLGDGTNFNVGDEIEVKGVSQAGDFVPLVFSQEIRVLGRAALPKPVPVTFEQLATGKEDSQWVEVRGEVRSIVPAVQEHTRLDLLLDGQRLSALVTHFDWPDSGKLIGATVRVRGVVRTRFNNKRQICAAYISVSSSEDVVVDIPASGEPVTVPLSRLLWFNSEGYYGRRVKVPGIVTEQKGNSLFIQDGGDGLYVKTDQTNALVPGDLVEATGFPLVGQYSPVLEDALVCRVGHAAPPTPINARMNQLVSADYECGLVRVRGTLMNQVQRAGEQVLIVEADNLILNARLEASKADRRFSQLQKGSELELTGVCLAQPMENWNPSIATRPETFQLLLRSASDVVVVHNPPWWTLARLLWIVAIMGVVLSAGFAWVVVLDRRVRKQTAIIQQKLQREAVLEERTRIAREFHDTLEQELVAITIQLETVAAKFDEAPRTARQMLELARNMSRRSLFEARRSVWDLRSHLLENSNLVNAVAEVAKLMSRSSGVPIEVENSGVSRRLPPQMENNLLRITQEALANALKHARATRIVVRLDFQPAKVCLSVTDDGVGFEADNQSVIYGGHFGLLDMSERAEKMGGRYTMISAPGQGTEIRVEVAGSEELSFTTGASAELEMRAAG